MATVEVFNYLNEVPGIHLALPTRCKLPECYSMVYFPYHVWRLTLKENNYSMFWLFCCEDHKAKWLELMYSQFHTSMGIMQHAIIKELERVKKAAELLEVESNG